MNPRCQRLLVLHDTNKPVPMQCQLTHGHDGDHHSANSTVTLKWQFDHHEVPC